MRGQSRDKVVVPHPVPASANARPAGAAPRASIAQEEQHMAGQPPEQRPGRPRSLTLGAGVAIGVAIGAALGVALDNLAVGIALGIGIGLALSLALPRPR
jgi:hypothetical protein